MGTHPAPAFANNFMAKIDIKIWDIIEEIKVTENMDVKSLNRFLDDQIVQVVAKDEWDSPICKIHNATHHNSK